MPFTLKSLRNNIEPNLASASKATKKPRPSDDNVHDDDDDDDDYAPEQVDKAEALAIAAEENLFDILGDVVRMISLERRSVTRRGNSFRHVIALLTNMADGITSDRYLPALLTHAAYVPSAMRLRAVARHICGKGGQPRTTTGKDVACKHASMPTCGVPGLLTAHPKLVLRKKSYSLTLFSQEGAGAAIMKHHLFHRASGLERRTRSVMRSLMAGVRKTLAGAEGKCLVRYLFLSSHSSRTAARDLRSVV
jgi:hypothetical protein